MQILAVPLARRRLCSQVQIVYVVRNALMEKQGDRSVKPSYMQRMVNRASDFWVGLGRNDKSSILDWRRRTYRIGERIMDQISYEEWELKNMDTKLGAPIRQLLADHQQQKQVESVKIQYPPQLTDSTQVLNSLSTLSTTHRPLHYRKLMYNILGIIITSPLFIVPGLPNLPTYYLMWRAWSHWRAYSITKEIDLLLENKLMEAIPNAALGDHLAAEPDENAGHEWQIYLTRDKIEPLVKFFELSSQESIDLHRAQDQISAEVQKSSTPPSSDST
ncbi:hypothetical protein MYAM1_001933 [Malassezia yamatoensis]|uniref:Mitochondrial K+-H+ exchange-related-domain-containing protein n=1 Tax=Malassezia yamatoensis TaxID=253288 RepID=A0AAJ5YZ44_9BASI|nr:hypothetical protein MYAM1_001933 [Malassezia yamatoensis]